MFGIYSNIIIYLYLSVPSIYLIPGRPHMALFLFVSLLSLFHRIVGSFTAHFYLLISATNKSTIYYFSLSQILNDSWSIFSLTTTTEQHKNNRKQGSRGKTQVSGGGCNNKCIFSCYDRIHWLLIITMWFTQYKLTIKCIILPIFSHQLYYCTIIDEI